MENNQNNKNDKRNSLLGLLLVAGVVFYIWKTRKPKAYAIESGESTESGGGGGVIMGGGMPLIVTPPAPPVPPVNTTPPPSPSVPKPIFRQIGNTGTTVTCGSGYIYNPATKKCEVMKPVEQAPEDALRKARDAAQQAGGGLSSAPVGGGTTGGGTTGGSSTAPPVGGGSTTTRPVGGGGTTPTCPTGYMYNSVMKKCVKMDDGEVGGGGMLFSGKMPLTLDNLLC